MDALSRSLIRSLRRRIVTTALSTRFVVFAFALRAYARDLAASAMYLMIIVPRVAPDAHHIFRYVRRCAPPSWSHYRAGADVRNGLHPRPIGAESVGGAIRLPALQKTIAVLRDERVVRLQRSIVTHTFSPLPGIRLTAPDLTVLARFSSVSWLLRNLLVAAGCVEGMSRLDQAHRLSVVFPVFIAAMRVHSGHLEGRATAGAGKLRCRRLTRRVRGVGPNGEIVCSLYPESLTVERLRRRAESARDEGATRLFRFRVAEQRGRYERYLDAVTLVVQSARGQYGPADELRVMKSVLKKMEETWQLGRTTTTGTGA